MQHFLRPENRSKLLGSQYLPGLLMLCSGQFYIKVQHPKYWQLILLDNGIKKDHRQKRKNVFFKKKLYEI